jgi:hypothetical protein
MMKRFIPLLNIFLVLNVLLATCGPTPTPKVIEKVVEETVAVEKEVEVEVTKVVEKVAEVTVEVPVEKAVTPVPEVPVPTETKVYHACDVMPKEEDVAYWWEAFGGEQPGVWRLHEDLFSVDGLNGNGVVSNCTALFVADLRYEDLWAEITFEDWMAGFNLGEEPVKILGYVATIYEFSEANVAREIWKEANSWESVVAMWPQVACKEGWIDPQGCENYWWSNTEFDWDDGLDIGTMVISICGSYDPDPEGLRLPGSGNTETATVSVVYFWDRWMFVTTVYDVDRYLEDDELTYELVNDLAREFAARQLDSLRSPRAAVGAVAQAASLSPKTPDAPSWSPAAESGHSRLSAGEGFGPGGSLASYWYAADGGQGNQLVLSDEQQEAKKAMQIVLKQVFVADDKDTGFLFWDNDGDVYILSRVDLLNSGKPTQFNKWPYGSKYVNIGSNETATMDFTIWKSDETQAFLNKDFRAKINLWVYDEDSGDFLDELAKTMKKITWSGLPLPLPQVSKEMNKVIQEASNIFSLARKTGADLIDRFGCNPCPVKALCDSVWASGHAARPPGTSPVVKYEYGSTTSWRFSPSGVINQWMFVFSKVDLAKGDILYIKDSHGQREIANSNEYAIIKVVGDATIWVDINSEKADRSREHGFILEEVLAFYPPGSNGIGENECSKLGDGACFYFKRVE